MQTRQMQNRMKHLFFHENGRVTYGHLDPWREGFRRKEEEITA